MENVATCANAGPDRTISFSRWIAVAAAGWCALGGASAQEMAPHDKIVADVRAEAPMRLEVNTSALPRFEGQDSGFPALRIGLSLLPPAGLGLGVAVGMSGFSPRAGLQSHGAARTSMDLGVHLRQTVYSNQVDVTAWRRFTPDDDAYSLIQRQQPVYGARVEMKLASAPKAGLQAERGFVGMQLESGAKISIKRKDGRPMVYYRTSF